MTDKEKLDRIKKLADAMYTTAQYLTTDASGLRKAMDEYHRFITHDYNKQEPASEDLEQAAEEFGIRQGVELKPFAIKFFKAGAEWQKEQMMKDAVIIEDELAMCYNNGAPMGLSPYKEWWETPEVQSRFTDGDKVKVIIVKDND